MLQLLEQPMVEQEERRQKTEEQALFRNVLQLCRKIFLAIKEGVL